MKVLCIILMLIMLSGCGPQQMWETVDDTWIEAVAPCREIIISLPSEAVTPTLQSDEVGKLYLCNGYTLSSQILPGGDLNRTIYQITGFSLDQLTCIQTQFDYVKRYECVWSSAGEAGDHVGRAVILDDGNHHYAVSVMADSGVAGDLTQTWQTVLGSVSLTDTD